jgi:hypothetical protein
LFPRYLANKYKRLPNSSSSNCKVFLPWMCRNEWQTTVSLQSVPAFLHLLLWSSISPHWIRIRHQHSIFRLSAAVPAALVTAPSTHTPRASEPLRHGDTHCCPYFAASLLSFLWHSTEIEHQCSIDKREKAAREPACITELPITTEN